MQYAMYRTVPGLEKVKIVRNAYAIEYDCINSLQLKATLEFKKIEGLFSGDSLTAVPVMRRPRFRDLWPVNAAMKIMGREQIVLDRSQAYIGVLIDDLVTKEKP